jgi:hypothetical protein
VGRSLDLHHLGFLPACDGVDPADVHIGDRVDGVAVGDNTGLGAGVIWIKSGTVYGVAGTLKQDAILAIANGLK